VHRTDGRAARPTGTVAGPIPKVEPILGVTPKVASRGDCDYECQRGEAVDAAVMNDPKPYGFRHDLAV